MIRRPGALVGAAALVAASLVPGPASAEPASGGVASCAVEAFDSSGPVPLGSSHASISSTLPPELSAGREPGDDREELGFRLTCPRGALPPSLRVESRRPSGEPLDFIDPVAVKAAECDPPRAGLECGVTERIRATVDAADRTHPSVQRRSLLAEVGGSLIVGYGGREAATLPVGGPRHGSRGPVDRFRASLRVHIVRSTRGGAPAVAGTDERAQAVLRGEIRTASMLWGQCGIHFGDERDVPVRVVDPPPRYLLAVGCEVGLPASGGEVRLAVGSTTIRLATRPGATPVTVAHELAALLRPHGLRAEVTVNGRVTAASARTADVVVRRADGSLADLAPGKGPLSSDPTLPVCLGEVDLSDGLRHFNDDDAAAGTLEERTLVKAYEDGDPTTVDVFVVPSFAKTGRIGESFIDGDAASIQNVVLVDRLSIVAGSRSYALAHELGHVLMDLPGHPDDFGTDRPWALMDADAADSSIYGPRRLPIADCERALLQSGPGSVVPLLAPWPLRGGGAARTVNGARSR